MKRWLYSVAPLLILFGIIIIACVVAFFIVQLTGDSYALRKVVKKTTQIFLLFSLVPLMRWLHFNAADLGFSAVKSFSRQLFQGFGLGFITLIPVFILLTLWEVNVIDLEQPWTNSWLAKKVLLELLLALLIGFFEETLFRGILLSSLRQALPTSAAIFISAFYYASLHFLDSKTDIPLSEVTLFSGLQLFQEALFNLFDPEVFSAFASLLMVGIFLGLLRTQIKHSLGYCIGCHACWVWQIKLNKSFFNTDYFSPYAVSVSHYDGVIGPLVTSWLLLAIFLFSALKYWRALHYYS